MDYRFQMTGLADGHLTPGGQWSLTAITIITAIVVFLFILSVRKTYNQVPKEHHVCSAGLLWFFLLFVLNLFFIWLGGNIAWLSFFNILSMVFYWIMIPFAVPNTLRKYLANNPEAVRKTRHMFGVGLAWVICSTVALFPPLAGLFGIASLVLMIIYWCQVVSVRQFLAGHSSHTAQHAHTKM